LHCQVAELTETHLSLKCSLYTLHIRLNLQCQLSQRIYLTRNPHS
jgi:hypothetical protein